VAAHHHLPSACLISRGGLGLTLFSATVCSPLQLGSIPHNISSMRQLSRLTLHVNNLEDLPTSLSVMTWIQELNCLDNPLDGVPPEAYAAK
jgi:Leucine-rich repeat (LRR) protein